jgi:outer membrane protein OmpA-like peptidoglycan-associated protein
MIKRTGNQYLQARSTAILVIVGAIILLAMPLAAQAPPDWSPRMSTLIRPDPLPPHPAPRIEVILRPTLITAGDVARLQWRSFHAERVFLNGLLVAPYGDIPISPDRNTEYHFTTDGPGGRAHEVATLTVLRRPIPPSARLIVQPERIAAGQCADLLWSTENALTVRIDGDEVPVYGVRRICPDQSRAWQLTAEGPAGTISRRIFIEVMPAPSPPPPPAVPKAALVVRFDYNQARITAEAERTLVRLAERLSSGFTPILVVGHADDRGTAGYNTNLGLRRATAVRDRLAALGVRADRIELRTRGAEDPIAPNETPGGKDNPEGRRLNRRVEIVLP